MGNKTLGGKMKKQTLFFIIIATILVVSTIAGVLAVNEHASKNGKKHAKDVLSKAKSHAKSQLLTTNQHKQLKTNLNRINVIEQQEVHKRGYIATEPQVPLEGWE